MPNPNGLLLAVLIAAGMLSMNVTMAASGNTTTAAPAEPTLRVATFGTSLTRRGGWQEALAHKLNTCLERRIDVLNVARSGASSNWGVKAVNEVTEVDPDVVLIEFSVNDAALHRFVTLGQSAENIRTIVAAIRNDRPEADIYLMTMSPVIGLRGTIRPFLGAYYAIYRDLAADLGTGFIDNRPAWAKLTTDDLKRVLPDGSHPKPDVAIRLIVPNIVDAISNGNCRGTGG